MASLTPLAGSLGHRHALHLLRRATFKMNKTSVDQVAAKTATAAVDDLFVIPNHILPEPIDRDTLDHFINLGIEPLSSNFNQKSSIMAWWMEEALNDDSIAHKLEFFLHSIFITSFAVGQPRQNFDYLNLFRLTSTRYTNGSLEMDSFKNLAMKIVTDNVMLQYLNGNQNTVANPNENFAREFFELFTIGKGPQIGPGNYTNYTEDDIVEAAKVFTGWRNRTRILGPGGDPNYTDLETGIQRGQAQYSKHDATDKTFSSAFGGITITGAAYENDMWRELSDFVDMIFTKFETAKNIVRKIYRYYVGRNITTEIETDIISPLAITLKNNQFKISAVIKDLLKSEHFYDMDDANASDEIIGNMVKSPFEMLLQTMSFFGITTPDYLTDSENHYYRWYRLTVKDIITTGAGMTFFYPNSVAGYPAYYQDPNYARNWFNGSTLIARYKQAEILLTGNRVLSGGTNGGVKLDIAKFVNNSGVFSDPYDAQQLVDDMIHYLFPETPDSDRNNYFFLAFLDGLSPINWQFEWANYVNTGDDTSVKIPLQTLFKLVTSSQEYGLK